MRKKFIVIIVILFVVLSVLFYRISCLVPSYQFIVLELGNFILAVLSISSYLIVSKNVTNRPHAFVQGVNGASLLKLMVCLIAMIIYVMIYRSQIHKPSVFVFFGLYAVYTTIETWILYNIAKEKK